jgi:hypothetical protein
MKSLRDYALKLDNPTTPLPATNPTWQQTNKHTIPYYEREGLAGLTLCYAAISDHVNRHPGIIPDALTVSNLHLPEIRGQYEARFGVPCQGAIPYLYDSDLKIKWIRIGINNSMPKHLVFLSVKS